MVFLGSRFWRHFCEYNGDLTAVIAGYGNDIASELRLDKTRQNIITRLTGFHPASRRRADFIAHNLAQYGEQVSEVS